jgi:hypothetical protein
MYRRPDRSDSRQRRGKSRCGALATHLPVGFLLLFIIQCFESESEMIFVWIRPFWYQEPFCSLCNIILNSGHTRPWYHTYFIRKVLKSFEVNHFVSTVIIRNLCDWASFYRSWNCVKNTKNTNILRIFRVLFKNKHFDSASACGYEFLRFGRRAFVRILNS